MLGFATVPLQINVVKVCVVPAVSLNVLPADKVIELNVLDPAKFVVVPESTKLLYVKPPPSTEFDVALVIVMVAVFAVSVRLVVEKNSQEEVQVIEDAPRVKVLILEFELLKLVQLTVLPFVLSVPLVKVIFPITVMLSWNVQPPPTPSNVMGPAYEPLAFVIVLPVEVDLKFRVPL